jgi:hypothetical protein
MIEARLAVYERIYEADATSNERRTYSRRDPRSADDR